MPFTSVPLGKTTFQITTSVGRCLQTYDLQRGLNLVFVSRPQTPQEITASYAWKDRVFAAWSTKHADGAWAVWVFKRGRKVGELERPSQRPHPLKRLLIFGSWIVGCSSSQVEVWKSATYEHYTTLRPTLSKDLGGDELSGAICTLPTFLNKILVGKRDGAVDVWNLSSGKLVHTIHPPSPELGAVSALEPSPALSIVAIGREDGTIHLHHVLKDEVVLKLNSKSLEGRAVTSMSFRTDGLGAGIDGTKDGIMASTSRGNGDVILWDLSRDGQVSGILHGAHQTVSASSTEGEGVNKVEFLPGQDVIITSGTDNALKSWIFDANSLSSIPRILHQRCGHAAPLTKLAFVPSNSDDSDMQGKWLISAGRDRAMWGWSLRRDGQSTELSQGHIQKRAKKLDLHQGTLDTPVVASLEDLRAPQIVSIACSLNRDGGMGTSTSKHGIWTNAATAKKSEVTTTENAITSWESIVTGHRGDKYARTWFWGSKRAGRWALQTADGKEVTCVAITTCGSFALVGSAGGSISMFNLQSGIQRQKFPSPITASHARNLRMQEASSSKELNEDGNKAPKYIPGRGKHERAISGLIVDDLNRTVISCSLDGRIKFWDFRTGHLLDEINWFPMTTIISCQYHRSNNLLALSCDDLSIRIVDTETKKTVREFWGCLGQISDVCFSNDGRWLIAASMDAIIRVWDLPTGHLINALRLESPCTALAFSDTGEFLATAHADSVGVNLWNNRALFAHVPIRPIVEDDLSVLAAPTASGENGNGMIDAALDTSDEDEDAGDSNAFSDGGEDSTLDKSMQRLSLVPKAHWQTLLHLDTIRQRNKPVEPPKAPEKAPFFLPSLDSSKPVMTVEEPTDSLGLEEAVRIERSRISKMDRVSAINPFTAALHQSTSTKDFTPFISYLSDLSPSVADVEIRSLNPTEFVPFVQALIFGLQERKGYELMQAWMAVFLRIHGEIINGEAHIANLREILEAWREEQTREGKRLGHLVGFCDGVVGFLRSIR